MSNPIKEFATANRLKIILDDCGDPIIAGRRAQLYFDGPELCLIGVDSLVTGLSEDVLKALKARWIWVGDLLRDEKRRGHRDVWLKGIPKVLWGAAIKAVKYRTRRKLTEEQSKTIAGRLKAGRQAATTHKTPSKAPSIGAGSTKRGRVAPRHPQGGKKAK